MSRYGSCTWKPLANRSKKPLQKDLLSLHTCVGSGWGTWNYFNTGAGGRGVYSHIVVCGMWGSADQNRDGLGLQMQDTDLRAAANLDGNWHIVSVETADNAARPIEPWTAKQQDTLVRIMVDANRLDGIPLVLVPDSKVGRRGIGYHRQGCNPYRVSGGELWSEAYGKDCPTDARIRQIPGLIARARAVVAGPQEEDDMPLNGADKEWLRALTGAGGGVTVTGTTQDVYNKLHTEIADVKASVAAQGRETNRILGELLKAQAPPVEPPA